MKKIFTFLVIAIMLSTSCQKFVDPGLPVTQLTQKVIFNNASTAHAAMMGIYSSMEADYFMYNLILSTGLSADELTNYTTFLGSIDLATNNLTPDNPNILRLWELLYKYIYQANNILSGIQSSVLNVDVKNQIEGEAKFIRAFSHYYLTSLFGEIPIVTTADYRITSTQGRLSQDEVFKAIKIDLEDAIHLLPGRYINSTGGMSTERVRPNRFAAKVILVRVLMIEKKWEEAEKISSEIINENLLYSLVPNLNNIFLKNSAETIWQLMSVIPQNNSTVGAQMILVSRPSVFAIDTNFVNYFQSGDLRKSSWINSITVSGTKYFFPYKYKVGQNASSVTEYTMMLRLSEVILNRAESLAQQGKLSQATQDINVIRLRAGLSQLTSLNQSLLLEEIYNERRFELFSESGMRWLDIRRTGNADERMSKKKDSNWTSTDILYPIPQIERDRNPNLSQNDGY